MGSSSRSITSYLDQIPQSLSSFLSSIPSATSNLLQPLKASSSGTNKGKHRGLGDYDIDGEEFEDVEGLMKGKEKVEGGDDDLVIKDGKRIRKVELRIGGMTVSTMSSTVTRALG